MARNDRLPPDFDEWKLKEWRCYLDTSHSSTKISKQLVFSWFPIGWEKLGETLVDDLNKDPGTNTLLTNLDSLFLEEKDQTYDVSCLEKITTDPSVTVTSSTMDFEQWYSHTWTYTMELPNAVLAFKSLDAACLDAKVFTACSELTFTFMKSTLKRIFGRKSEAVSSRGINQEMVNIP